VVQTGTKGSNVSHPTTFRAPRNRRIKQLFLGEGYSNFAHFSSSPLFFPISSTMNPITRYGEVLAHGRTNLDVVYTNDSAMVPHFLSLLQKWLQVADEKDKFIGLDLEYTAKQEDVAVIQLCFKKHVMIFQWAR
jgi:hypothetical protein